MVDRVSVAAAQLVSRYRRQRPLRGGSLLVTLFGDAIAPRGGRITLGSLIGLAAPFGLNERLVRTSMARLAEDGWLESRRLGRLSEYQLSHEGRERFDAATQQIYGVPGQAWPGTWTLVLIGNGRRAREAAREVLGWAGFGEPSQGVFVHPTLEPAEVSRLLHRSPDLREAIVLSASDGTPDSDRRLVTLGWDLDELAGRYRRFVTHFRPVLEALGEREHPAPPAAFIIRTFLIHEYRRIHLRDPLLPAALLPPDWVGTDAYRLCRTIYARTAPAAEAHLSACGATLDGALPPANAAWSQRFGDLAR